MQKRVPKNTWFGRRRSSDGRRGAAPDPSRAESSGRKGNGAVDAKRNFTRYVELAKAAASSGDRIESEKYYQYADHFLRLMKDKPA